MTTAPTAPAPSVAGPDEEGPVLKEVRQRLAGIANRKPGRFPTDEPEYWRGARDAFATFIDWLKVNEPRTPTRGYARGLRDAEMALEETDDTVHLIWKAGRRLKRPEARAVLAVCRSLVRALAAAPQGAGDGGGLLDEMAVLVSILVSRCEGCRGEDRSDKHWPECTTTRGRALLARYDALTTTEREGGAPEVVSQAVIEHTRRLLTLRGKAESDPDPEPPPTAGGDLGAADVCTCGTNAQHAPNCPSHPGYQVPGDAGRGRTAEEERADVAAWLRRVAEDERQTAGNYDSGTDEADAWNEHASADDASADAIESGEHIGAGAPRRTP